MSFRKRGEVIGNPSGNTIANAVPRRGVPGGVPGRVPGRVPLGLGTGISSRSPAPSLSRVPPEGGVRSVVNPMRRPGDTPVDRQKDLLEQKLQDLSLEEEIKHPGIKPSTITSQSTVSTGSSDLDKLLGHSGLPLSSMMLIEESGTTEFSSVLTKIFASQGIIHNRLDPRVSNTHVILLSSNNQWGKELPGLYKGSSKDIKKRKILENENKLSVQNLIDNEAQKSKPNAPVIKNNDKDLKIAWRYGLNDSNKRAADENDDETNKDFNHQFDITSRLTPTPGANEITVVPITPHYASMIKRIETVISKNKSKVIRLIMPSFLNPSMYPMQFITTQEILPFVHSLRSLTRKHNNLVIATTLATDLFPKESSMVKQLENLYDAVLHLEPFDQEMLRMLEKAYQNQPGKVQHGLVHVYKVPVLSERGQMLVMKSEFAFKNGKKKFEIEEWGIPLEDEGEEKQTPSIDF